MNDVSKFQKFEMDTIQRDEIKNAGYNPRVISKDAEKRLKKMIARHGLVQPLVWNKRTGNLVGGHQRLNQIDALEKSNSYSLLVAVIDVTLKEEKVLNVQLNNPSMMGDWDNDKLFEMTSDGSITPDEFGFSDGDIAVMFGHDEIDALTTDSDEVKDSKETLNKIKKHRAESIEKMKGAQCADFYFVVVCESVEQKRALLDLLKVPYWEDYMNGAVLARELGV